MNFVQFLELFDPNFFTQQKLSQTLLEKMLSPGHSCCLRENNTYQR